MLHVCVDLLLITLWYCCILSRCPRITLQTRSDFSDAFQLISLPGLCLYSVNSESMFVVPQI